MNDAKTPPIDTASQDKLLLTASMQLLRYSREKIFIKDANLIYCAASTKFAQMAGWKDENDLIGKTDFDIFEDQALAQRYRDDDLKLIAQNTDLIDYIEPLTEKDGKPRYASTSKFILRDDNGNFMGLVGVSRDITMEYYLQRNRTRELEYLFALPRDVYFAAYMDIEDWRIISEHHQSVNGFDFAYHGKIDILASNAYSRLVYHNSPAGELYRNFTPDALTALSRKGKREIVLEYQRLIAFAERRWVRDEIHFMEDSISGHLCMMLVVRDIQQRKMDEEEQLLMAERDEVTGLLNRRATMQLIRERLAQSTPGEQHALFMIDADYFKDVNNTYGHQAGDQTLTQFARAISDCFRVTDVIGRIGGDEFFVLMTQIPNRESVAKKASALLDSLRAVHYADIHLSASIGICLYPDDAATLDEMYSLSDKAMYAIKDAGRNGICFVSDLESHQN